MSRGENLMQGYLHYSTYALKEIVFCWDYCSAILAENGNSFCEIMIHADATQILSFVNCFVSETREYFFSRPCLLSM